MTSDEKKIILDKGSDYKLLLTIPADDGINERNIAGWKWEFVLYDATTGEKISGNGITNGVIASATLSTAADDFTNVDAPIINQANHGKLDVVIDSAVTSTLDTKIVGDEDKFGTYFRYFYTLTIYELPLVAGVSREMRLARGKLAVRV